MPEPGLAPRSALAGIATPGRFGRAGAPGLALAEVRPRAVVAITARDGRAQALAARLGLPAGPGVSRDGTVDRVWAGPGQWVAFDTGAPGAAASEAMRRIFDLPADLATPTDLGGARVVLRLAGASARRALAKLLPIDLHASVFAAGAGAATVAAHVPVLVWLAAEDEGFHLACYRSFGVALWRALAAASAEYGYDVIAPPG